MIFHLLHPRDQIIRIIFRIYHNRMTTLSGGNLSIKDRNGDTWITPAGIDKGKLRPEDIVCVKADGTVTGPHRPSSEYPFHRWIYEKRSDIGAIVHAHPPALVSFSITRRIPDTNIIPQANRVCGRVGFAPYALPGSEQLGEYIAAAFAEGFNVVLLENHGVVTGGTDILNAFHRMETLEFCARTMIQARRMGAITTLTEEEISWFDQRRSDLPEFIPEFHSSLERELRQQIIDTVHRACDRFLMISTEGVVSARLDDDSFLITPTGIGRRSMEIEDIVLVDQGRRERGKQPSRSVRMHELIYTTHPQINCIIMAQSPNAAAFAISSREMATKTIPESYILLRDIPKVPYGTFYRHPGEVVNMISGDVPVLLIRNDCVLTVGRSVLEAFDRLEVADFSARSLIDTHPIGAMVPISERDVDELRNKFFGSTF